MNPSRVKMIKRKKILSADEYKIFIDLLSKIDDNTE